ncbi:MAG: ATP-binding cassette domain-containing protein, partial [bacterium]|nr:ATP-binding cassette domain-containing protein [bacterium]
MRVAPGESVAVTGASGSGKSTLLHCLTGLRRPTSGTVIFEGAPISALSDNARSRLRLERMGIVFQFGELLPELTL